MPEAPDVKKAVQHLLNANLKTKLDFSLARYIESIEHILQARPELVPHLDRTARLLCEDEEWMPPTSAWKSRLELLYRAETVRPDPRRTAEHSDDLRSTARNGIRYLERRNKEKVKLWLVKAAREVATGRRTVLCAEDLLDQADKDLA